MENTNNKSGIGLNALLYVFCILNEYEHPKIQHFLIDTNFLFFILSFSDNKRPITKNGTCKCGLVQYCQLCESYLLYDI
jgi:hypothetical protein